MALLLLGHRPVRDVGLSRNLRLLAAAQFVSLLGDGLYLAVIVNYALRISGESSFSAGMCAVAEYLPYLLLGIWAGALVDRSDCRKVMMGADLLRAGVLLGLYAMDHAGWLLPYRPAAAVPVGIAAALLTSGAVFFNPARDAYILDLAEGKDLLKANSLVASSQYAATLLGPLTAALLLAARPLAEAFAWDALSFVGSFACLAMIRASVPARPAGAGGIRLLDGVRYVRARPELAGLILLTALNNLFLMGPAMVGSAFLVNDMAKRGGLWMGLKPEAMYAVYLSVFASGLIAGVWALNRFFGKLPRWKVLAWAVLLDGVTFLPFEPIARAASFPLLLAALFVHALVVPGIVVVRPALIQAHVPRERLGQVFALVNLTVFGCTALSAALTGVLCGWGLAPSWLFVLAGAGGTLCGLTALGMRSLRTLV